MNCPDDLSFSRCLLRSRILLFLVGGVLLIVGIGDPPVTRTQSACWKRQGRCCINRRRSG